MKILIFNKNLHNKNLHDNRLHNGLQTQVHFLEISLKLNISEILQWVLHLNILELLLKYHFHTFMTSSILLWLKF